MLVYIYMASMCAYYISAWVYTVLKREHGTDLHASMNAHEKSGDQFRRVCLVGYVMFLKHGFLDLKKVAISGQGDNAVVSFFFSFQDIR